MNRAIRVFVVDDHDGFRQVARIVIEAAPGFELAGDAAEWSTAISRLSDGDIADLVLVDVHLGETSGVDLAAALTANNPELRVALISTLASDELPDEARRCGAFGFLPKVRLGPGALEDLQSGLYDWPQ